MGMGPVRIMAPENTKKIHGGKIRILGPGEGSKPFYSFHASGNFCLLITFANSLDPDQDQQNIGPDLDPKSLKLIVLDPERVF